MLALVSVFAGRSFSADLTAEQKLVVVEIEKHGGKVEEDATGDGFKVSFPNRVNGGFVEGKPDRLDLSLIRALPGVVDVDLGFQQDLTDADLAKLQGMTKLRSLNLIGTEIADQGMPTVAGMTELRELYLPHRVSNAGLLTLKGMPALEFVNLGETSITDAGLASLKEIKSLRRITLMGMRSMPPVTDAGMAHLAEMVELRSLILAGKVTNDGLRQLKRLKQLRVLSLGNVNITDAGLVHLEPFTELEWLNLPGGISDKGLEALALLKNLRQLDGIGDDITDAGLVHLQSLKELRSLNTWCAQITGGRTRASRGAEESAATPTETHPTRG